jgi:hypothetical protein
VEGQPQAIPTVMKDGDQVHAPEGTQSLIYRNTKYEYVVAQGFPLMVS